MNMSQSNGHRAARKAGDISTIPEGAYCDCCGQRLARARASIDCVLCSSCMADGLGIEDRCDWDLVTGEPLERSLI